MTDDGGMSRTAPLFRFDPGWLFTLAGLVVMVASALLPAERDLHELRQQLSALEFREAYNAQRLQAYDRFMKDLSARDPALLRRLAASQLNLMPDDVEPLLMATSIESTVSDWIEATVPQEAFQPTPPPDTLLTRLADGPRRLWLMGGGAVVVFLGLVMGFSVSPRPSLPAQEPDVESWREAVEAEVAAEAEAAAEERAEAAIEAEQVVSVVTADEAFDELPVETGDVDGPAATAEALEEESFEWPQVQPPFELAGSETSATVDGASIASAWQDTIAVDQSEAEDAWLRGHGTD
ncbi:MAG: hypothetical protein EBR71_00900 [Planctomycetes bacterium]|nr:hypothetical protein [Planctomycetota bacterium]